MIDGRVARAIALVPLLWGLGCGSSARAPQQATSLSNSAAAIESSCPALGAPHAEADPNVADGFVLDPPPDHLRLDLSHRPSVTFDVVEGPVSARVTFSDGLVTDIWSHSGGLGYDERDLAQALASIPWGLRKHVRQIDLRTEIGSSQTALAETPYGMDGTIKIFKPGWGLPVGNLSGVLTQKAGHSLIYETFATDQDPWLSYERIIAEEPVYVSEFAKTGGKFEDFAETMQLYIAVIGTPAEDGYRRWLPKRFAFIDQIKPDRRFDHDPCAGTKQQKSPPNSGGIAARFEQTQLLQFGYCGELYVKNISDAAIQEWWFQYKTNNLKVTKTSGITLSGNGHGIASDPRLLKLSGRGEVHVGGYCVEAENPKLPYEFLITAFWHRR